MLIFEGLTFALAFYPLHMNSFSFFFFFFLGISWIIFPFSHAGKKEKRKGITANILTRKIIFCLLKNNHCQHPNKETLPLILISRNIHLPPKPDPHNWPGPTWRVTDGHHQIANWNQACISKNHVCRWVASLVHEGGSHPSLKGDGGW